MSQISPEMIKLILPLVLIEVFLKVFCFIKLSKDKVKYLSKIAWGLIIIFINTFGPLAYLFIGRERD